MTEQQKAVPEQKSTSLLAPGVKQVLAVRQMEAKAAAALAKTTWGNNVDVETRMAVAHYAQRHDIDAATEIDLLGGRIYLNSRFYLRKLAGMTERGLIEWHRLTHIEEDKRLADACAMPIPADASEDEQAMIYAQRAWARQEGLKRARLRIEHAIPEDAVSAAIFSVKLKGMDRPVEAAKWAGGKGKVTRTRKDGGTYQSDLDPIGDAFPVESCESRAIRRCLREVISHIPEARDALEVALLEADDLTEIVVKDATREAELRADAPGRKALRAGGYELPEEAPTAEAAEAMLGRMRTDELAGDSDPL